MNNTYFYKRNAYYTDKCLFSIKLCHEKNYKLNVESLLLIFQVITKQLLND